jgi:hypothetical protein
MSQQALPVKSTQELPSALIPVHDLRRDDPPSRRPLGKQEVDIGELLISTRLQSRNNRSASGSVRVRSQEGRTPTSTDRMPSRPVPLERPDGRGTQGDSLGSESTIASNVATDSVKGSHACTERA